VVLGLRSLSGSRPDDGGDSEDAVEAFGSAITPSSCVCLLAMALGSLWAGSVVPVESLAGTLVRGPGSPCRRARGRRQRRGISRKGMRGPLRGHRPCAP